MTVRDSQERQPRAAVWDDAHLLQGASIGSTHSSRFRRRVGNRIWMSGRPSVPRKDLYWRRPGCLILYTQRRVSTASSAREAKSTGHDKSKKKFGEPSGSGLELETPVANFQPICSMAEYASFESSSLPG